MEHHDKELVEEITKSKKMMDHKDDDFSKVQKYMEGKVISNCRMAFRIRCQMVGDIKGNFKDKYRRKGGEAALACEDCNKDEVQTQSHCLECPKWEEMRRGLDLSRLDDLVLYFQQMMKERMSKKIGS